MKQKSGKGSGYVHKEHFYLIGEKIRPSITYRG